MTCVITSAWHPFSDTTPWSSMNPDVPPAHGGLDPHGYLSSGSESRKASTGSSSGKKRASRAGTRSVSTLSAAQLERKRANDREAQRAIRQRTKDHIDHLEKSVHELRATQESSEQLVAVTQQRNRELEEENAYLRGRLSEAGYSVVYPVEGARPPEPGLLSVHSTSPSGTHTSASGSSIRRPPSTSTPRSISVSTSLSSTPRHGSFQQQAALPPGPPSAASVATWRPHDGMQAVQAVHTPAHPAPPHAQDLPHAPSPGSYGRPDRVDWTPTAPTYPFPAGQDQRPASYETHAPAPTSAPQQQQQQQQSNYAQPVQTFTSAPAPQPQQFHPPQISPPTDYRNITVPTFQTTETAAFPQSHHSPAFQPSHQPASYGPPAQALAAQYVGPPPPAPAAYQMASMQAAQAAAPGYNSPHGQMQPPVPTGAYHATPAEQHYQTQQQQQQQHQQQHQQQLAYRDDAGAASYALTHYASG